MKKFFRGLLKLPVTFYKTLIDFKYYKVLDKLPVSRAIGYIVVLSLLFSFIAVIPSAIDVSRSSKEFYRQYNEYAPDFQIVDGIMTTGKGSPVFMIDQPGKALVVVFDETDSVTPSSLNEYQSILLIDSDSIYIKTPLTEQDMLHTTIFPADIDKEGFTSYLGLVNIVNILFLGFYVIAFILLNLAGAFFISSFGNLLLSFKRVRLSFGKAYALACYASTLPILVKTLRHVFMVNILYFDIIYVLLGILYFWNAANVILKGAINKDSEVEN
ncbi:MAG: DUF1189 domain-containing protein [Clostridia bacterium]|nr:DUF1189 domain-containing protein [Clostridia bacterium]